MAQTLAEVLYDLGRAALAQQERQVAELRARTQALLAAAALVGSLFGVTAIDRAGLNAPAATALMLLAVSVFAGVYVLLPHRMHFVVDVYDVHRELYEEDIRIVHARLAFTFRDFRRYNKSTLNRLFAAFTIGTVLLVLQVGLWGWAMAVGS